MPTVNISANRLTEEIEGNTEVIYRVVVKSRTGKVIFQAGAPSRQELRLLLLRWLEKMLS